MKTSLNFGQQQHAHKMAVQYLEMLFPEMNEELIKDVAAEMLQQMFPPKSQKSAA